MAESELLHLSPRVVCLSGKKLLIDFKDELRRKMLAHLPSRYYDVTGYGSALGQKCRDERAIRVAFLGGYLDVQ